MNDFETQLFYSNIANGAACPELVDFYGIEHNKVVKSIWQRVKEWLYV